MPSAITLQENVLTDIAPHTAEASQPLIHGD